MTIADEVAHGIIKRSAMHVAASMIHGDYPERDRAYSMAHDVQDEVGGFSSWSSAASRCSVETRTRCGRVPPKGRSRRQFAWTLCGASSLTTSLAPTCPETRGR